MKRVSFFLFGLVICTRPIQLVNACFWDKDTLSHERKTAPNVFEIISGNFPRRSLDVYTFRSERRPAQLREAGFSWIFDPAEHQKKPLTDEALAWVDDLAVALDKLGRGAEGVQILKRVRELHPQRYETLANLGTLFVHQKLYQEGLSSLKEAIKINPDAHFGREQIQIELIEYVLTKDKPISLPLEKRCIDPNSPAFKDPWLLGIPRAKWSHELISAKGNTPAHIKPVPEFLCLVWPNIAERKGERCEGFCAHLKERGISIEEGVKGITGMMRFSQHDHPILLETLAHLLLAQTTHKPNRLASMAFLSASRSGHKQQYEFLAALSLVGHRFGLSEVNRTLQSEQKRGDALMKKITEAEKRWIERGEPYLEKQYQKRFLKKQSTR